MAWHGRYSCSIPSTMTAEMVVVGSCMSDLTTRSVGVVSQPYHATAEYPWIKVLHAFWWERSQSTHPVCSTWGPDLANLQGWEGFLWQWLSCKVEERRFCSICRSDNKCCCQNCFSNCQQWRTECYWHKGEQGRNKEARRPNGGQGPPLPSSVRPPAASWSQVSPLALSMNPSWPSPEVPLVPMGTLMQKSLGEHYGDCKSSSKDAHPCSAAGKKLGALHAVINKAGDNPVLKKAAGAYGWAFTLSSSITVITNNNRLLSAETSLLGTSDFRTQCPSPVPWTLQTIYSAVTCTRSLLTSTAHSSKFSILIFK